MIATFSLPLQHFLSLQFLRTEHPYSSWKRGQSLQAKVKENINAFFSIKNEIIENISDLRSLSSCQSS